MTNQPEALEQLREWVIHNYREAPARPGEVLPTFADYREATHYVKANGLVLLPSQHELNLGRYGERGVVVSWMHRQGQVWDATDMERDGVGHWGVQRRPTKESFICVPGFVLGPMTAPSLTPTIKVEKVCHCTVHNSIESDP